jgi:hypothetical protein
MMSGFTQDGQSGQYDTSVSTARTVMSPSSDRPPVSGDIPHAQYLLNPRAALPTGTYKFSTDAKLIYSPTLTMSYSTSYPYQTATGTWLAGLSSAEILGSSTIEDPFAHTIQPEHSPIKHSAPAAHREHDSVPSAFLLQEAQRPFTSIHAHTLQSPNMDMDLIAPPEIADSHQGHNKFEDAQVESSPIITKGDAPIMKNSTHKSVNRTDLLLEDHQDHPHTEENHADMATIHQLPLEPFGQPPLVGSHDETPQEDGLVVSASDAVDEFVDSTVTDSTSVLRPVEPPQSTSTPYIASHIVDEEEETGAGVIFPLAVSCSVPSDSHDDLPLSNMDILANRSSEGTGRQATNNTLKKDAFARQSPDFDPRLLLNPKKTVKRPAGQISDDSPYSTPSPHNAYALLNPRGVKPPTPKSFTPEGTPNGFGMASMMENLHGVQNRTKPLTSKRRKSDDSAGIETENEKKATFVGAGKGGVIGDYMRQKREEGARDGATRPGPVVHTIAGK